MTGNKNTRKDQSHQRQEKNHLFAPRDPTSIVRDREALILAVVDRESVQETPVVIEAVVGTDRTANVALDRAVVITKESCL